MQTTNGRANGDIRPAPDTFKLADWPRNCWYAAAYDVELKRELLGRTVAGRKPRHVPPRGRRAGGAGERLLAPADAALGGADRGRQGGLRLPRPGLQLRGPLHVHAVAEDDQPGGPRARLSGGRAPSLRLGVDRATRRWPTPTSCPTCTGTTIRSGPATAGCIHLECGYKLIVDNLMDLTHETFVHGATIGQRSIAEVPFEVTHGPNSATVTRWMRDVEPPPFWKMQLEWKHGEPAGKGRPLADHPLRGAEHRRNRRRRRARRAPARPRATAPRASTATCSTR